MPSRPSNSSATGCANGGLDINADLAGTQQLRRGRANKDDSGKYYIMEPAGLGVGASQAVCGTRGFPGVKHGTRLQLARYTVVQGYTGPGVIPWARDTCGQGP